MSVGKAANAIFAQVSGACRAGTFPSLNFIGQHQIGLCPYRHHRLIPTPSFVMRQRRLLVTLDNRRILIYGSHPLGLPLFLIAPCDIPNPTRLHILKGPNWITLRKDEALLHLALRTQAFPLLVMKLFQKLSHRRDFRRLVSQPTLQTFVLRQPPQVFRTISPDGLQHGYLFNKLAFIKSTLAFLDPHIGFDQSGIPERPKDP
jgi:hypothetical protein